MNQARYFTCFAVNGFEFRGSWVWLTIYIMIFHSGIYGIPVKNVSHSESLWIQKCVVNGSNVHWAATSSRPYLQNWTNVSASSAGNFFELSLEWTMKPSPSQLASLNMFISSLPVFSVSLYSWYWNLFAIAFSISSIAATTFDRYPHAPQY